MAKPNQIGGMMELEKLFERLSQVPQGIATRASRKGATIALRSARRNAPEDTGELKRGLVLKRERSREKGRSVYQVTMDRAKNAHFVKMSKNGKRAYYPASQEYGFLTVDGGYIPGYRYLRRAADENEAAIEKAILDETRKEVDKALRKKGR